MTKPIRILVPDGANYRFGMKAEAMAAGKPFELVIPAAADEAGAIAVAGGVDAIFTYKLPLTRAIMQAATGARMILTTLYELRRRGGGIGLASMCAGGGMGSATVFEVHPA